jgi:triacylglycerol esterase/lipase EstA (alpha/beta hydrolase family)
MSLSDA